MLWLGGIILLVGVLWATKGDRWQLPQAPPRPVTRRRLTWPGLLIILGLILVCFDLFARKPVLPRAFDAAVLAPSERSLAGHIGFSFGDAKLVEGEMRELDMATAAMKAHPSAIMTMRAKVYVGGASYDTPEQRRRRAAAIRDHIVGAGISADRVFFDDDHEVIQAVTPGTYLRAYSGIDFIVLWH